MITINQTAQRTLGAKEISGSGSVLTLDGIDYDLSLLEDGATATNEPEDSQIISAERSGDDYTVEVLVWFDPTAEGYNPNFADEVITL